MSRQGRVLLAAALSAVAVTVSCATGARSSRATGATGETGPAVCAGEAAVPVTISGDFHVVYGDRPTYHLIWNARSAALQFGAPHSAAADSLLKFSQRRVVVTGAARADTATICVTSVALAAGGAGS